MIRQHNLKLYYSVALVHENNHVTLLMWTNQLPASRMASKAFILYR